MARQQKIDKELEEFRNLMQVPSTFNEGFNMTSLLGTLFIALIMVPGSIYMGLLAGGGIGPAVQWVTLILFVEVARRAQQTLKESEIFVLFFLSSAAMSVSTSGYLWTQFFVRSDSAVAYGISDLIPWWVAPHRDSASYALRTFLHPDWFPVIAVGLISSVIGEVSSMILGYGLFRLTSDIEKLPFPMAPIGVQGVLALAEDREEKDSDTAQKSWRWRVFSLGGALGIIFGLVYLGLPTITGALLGNPISIFEIPFTDLTAKTKDFMPAVATGIIWDLGGLLVGMVIPFFAIIGSVIGLIVMFIANPILYKLQILHSWTPGDDTIATLFKNNIDFYFSFGIGMSLAIAVVGIFPILKSLYKSFASKQEKMVFTPPPEGRGDIKPYIIIICYVIVSLIYIIATGFFIEWHRGVMIVMTLLLLVYVPLISFCTARLEGIAGQAVEIPMIREASMILSGYKGINIWFLPVPVANYGTLTVFYRQFELSGTKFTSLWKSKIVLFPIIFISSILFANFIWKLAPIPSATYPFTQKMWELQAANSCIMLTSTIGEYSIFEDAFKWGYLFVGLGIGTTLFLAMNYFGASTFLVYGLIQGLGNTMPHGIIPQFIGALIGKYYFQKKIGANWRQIIPVVVAGYSCGVGLITVLCIGIVFLNKAVIALPF